MCTELHFSLFRDAKNFLNSIVKLYGIISKCKNDKIYFVYHGKKILVQVNVIIGELRFIKDSIPENALQITDATDKVRLVSYDNISSYSGILLKLESYLFFLNAYAPNAPNVVYRMIVYKDGLISSLPSEIGELINKIQRQYPNSLELKLLEELDMSEIANSLCNAQIFLGQNFKELQHIELFSFLVCKSLCKSRFYSYIYSEFSNIPSLSFDNKVNPFNFKQIALLIHNEILKIKENRTALLNADIGLLKPLKEEGIINHLLYSLVINAKIVNKLPEI